MSVDKIKEMYDLIDQSTQALSKDLDFSYLEALHESLQNLALGQTQQIDGQPGDDLARQLDQVYQQSDWQNMDKEEMRKAIQIALIEGSKKDQLPANYQTTPEAIAILLAYMAVKLLANHDKDQALLVFDPVAGQANLYAVVVDHLRKNGFKPQGYLNDNDDLMLSLAEKSLYLQGEEAKIYLGDALQNLMVPPVDLVVADLPVGYYPVDQVATSYQSAFASGHAYAHYLLVEQAMNYMKANAWGLFIVPAQLFEEEASSHLVKAINSQGYFQAFLKLPTNLFKDRRAQKAILVVQKAGDQAKQASNVLIGDLPSLKDEKRMLDFVNSFSKWAQDLL
ncbi:hypothetical protein AWM75_07145 [Aerococcus urinaehominis]|uniref:Uncharacterized protein n=1 Tax=Aerococcus urinaehominis TaxID=128944 RepID=A0A0X8FLY2_9LACT|nr:class I SAM-dependent methyltransferase [Aerococcus urinaehominis]AMB99751.1 hypothetical protein AWM75_07145 [Aerococcus urinaehominis]SDM10327.1 site-specific DNA-methyltransferase (adenine-specific) [Aerococcus urinaehominis]